MTTTLPCTPPICMPPLCTFVSHRHMVRCDTSACYIAALMPTTTSLTRNSSRPHPKAPLRSPRTTPWMPYLPQRLCARIGVSIYYTNSQVLKRLLGWISKLMRRVFTDLYHKALNWNPSTALLLKYAAANTNFVPHHDDRRHRDAVVGVGLTGAAYLVICRGIDRSSGISTPVDIIERRLVHAGDVYALTGAALTEHYHAILSHPDFHTERVCLTLRNTFTFLPTEDHQPNKRQKRE